MSIQSNIEAPPRNNVRAPVELSMIAIETSVPTRPVFTKPA